MNSVGQTVPSLIGWSIQERSGKEEEGAEAYRGRYARARRDHRLPDKDLGC